MYQSMNHCLQWFMTSPQKTEKTTTFKLDYSNAISESFASNLSVIQLSIAIPDGWTELVQGRWTRRGVGGDPSPPPPIFVKGYTTFPSKYILYLISFLITESNLVTLHKCPSPHTLFRPPSGTELSCKKIDAI